LQDPTALFTIGALSDLDRPVLVLAPDGFIDAGNGRRLARHTSATRSTPNRWSASMLIEPVA
jgi:hypothetical protein